MENDIKPSDFSTSETYIFINSNEENQHLRQQSKTEKKHSSLTK